MRPQLPLLALFGPCAMSNLSPQCGPKRPSANASYLWAAPYRTGIGGRGTVE
jgi:hypothetical protein